MIKVFSFNDPESTCDCCHQPFQYGVAFVQDDDVNVDVRFCCECLPEKLDEVRVDKPNPSIICIWCDEQIDDTKTTIHINGENYHSKCWDEHVEADKKAYERQKYLEEKWEEQ